MRPRVHGSAHEDTHAQSSFVNYDFLSSWWIQESICTWCDAAPNSRQHTQQHQRAQQSDRWRTALRQKTREWLSVFFPPYIYESCHLYNCVMRGMNHCVTKGIHFAHIHLIHVTYINVFLYIYQSCHLYNRVMRGMNNCGIHFCQIHMGHVIYIIL